MVVIAPRIDSRLVAALVRIDDPRRPIAETNRRLGRVAAELGLAKPSYEQVRVIVHAIRRGKQEPAIGSLLLDLAFRTRSPRRSSTSSSTRSPHRRQVTVCYLAGKEAALRQAAVRSE